MVAAKTETLNPRWDQFERQVKIARWSVEKAQEQLTPELVETQILALAQQIRQNGDQHVIVKRRNVRNDSARRVGYDLRWDYTGLDSTEGDLPSCRELSIAFYSGPLGNKVFYSFNTELGSANFEEKGCYIPDFALMPLSIKLREMKNVSMRDHDMLYHEDPSASFTVEDGTTFSWERIF